MEGDDSSPPCGYTREGRTEVHREGPVGVEDRERTFPPPYQPLG